MNVQELDQVLEGYFEPVARLSDKLMKQVRFVLRRTLNTVRKDPKLIVTVLRIVEREEKLDADCLAQQKLTGFLPPGRPKMARQKVLEVLRTNVVERIEGNQLDERDQNKMWLVRHLELIRLITLEDLRVAKSLCQPVFPPEYNILEFYIRVYNEALTNRLKEIIATGLQDQEYVTMLSWIIQTYPGKELMGSDRLQLSKDQVPQLLDEATVLELERRYLENMKENYSKWLNNMMGLEVEDWSSSDRDPDLDSSGAFQTSAPLMVYQMIEENLQVAATISPELTRKVLVLSMDEVAAFGTTYRARAADYKAKYFRDRSKISSFTRYTIAIVNNCERFEELAIELKQRWWKAAEKAEKASSSSSSSASASLSPSGGSGKLAKNFEQVLSVFSALRTEASSYLLDEAFLDIDIQFGEILTSRWMTATDAIDTVCATLENYFEDYSYLRKKNLDAVISEARDRVARRYIAAIFAVTGGAGSANVLLNKMGRKVSVLEDADDRAKAADKVRFEAAQLKRFFRKVGGDSADFDSPFDAVSAMAEVIGADSEMLYLDVGTFTKRYPDLNQEQLFCILMVRGDMNRTECRTMAAEFVPDLGKPAGNATAQSSSTGSSSAASKSKVGTVATSVFSQVGVGSAAAAAAATASNLFSEATNVVASAVASAGASKDSTSLNPFSSGNSNRQSGGNNNPFGDDDDD